MTAQNPLPGALWRTEQYDTLGSTSDLCAARARAGEPDRLMVIAGAQTAGRGRAGRAWTSPQGNLYASILLRPDFPAGQGGLFALLAGLSLHEAIGVTCGTGATIHLKWPNDIMAGTAKLAGILLDATIISGRITTLIIGFGVNMVFAPAIAGRETTSLTAHGLRAAKPSDLAAALRARLDHWQATLTDNGAVLRAAWLSAAHPIGAAIAVDAGRLTGTFAGIEPDGSLLLLQGTRIIPVRSGDVALLTGSGAAGPSGSRAEPLPSLSTFSARA